MFMMRFGMRSKTTDSVGPRRHVRRRARYGRVGRERTVPRHGVSEHHASGRRLPPVAGPLAAAIAARTSTMPINVAALLLALYEPVKLAEDLAVVDLVSRGRVSYVIGIGYRDEEFDDVRRRPTAARALVEARIGILRRLWAGEDGRRRRPAVRVTPAPFTPGGPMLAYGGGTEVAAQRRGAPRDVLHRRDPRRRLEAAYRDEAERTGAAPIGCVFPSADIPLTVFVADDPDKAWAEIGEYLLRRRAELRQVERASPGDRVGVVRHHRRGARRRNEATYQIITPDEAAAYVARGRALGPATTRGRHPARYRVALPRGRRGRLCVTVR